MSRSAVSRATVVIGVTGPIGCGKSQVARWLGELGAVVVDADVVARDVVEPGTEALERVKAAFGPGVVRADGLLDRAALARVVFADRVALGVLEAIIHPAVRPRILQAIEAARAEGAPAIVLEAIKLVEGGLAKECDEVWLVSCDRDAQRRRLEERGLTADDAATRIAAQGNIVERLGPAATRVIDTSGDRAATRAAVEAAWSAASGGTR
jgi:dephospho-CoA kinase